MGGHAGKKRVNYRTTAIEASLNRSEFRWKGLRLLQHSFMLGSVLSALALAFGGVILLGWVTSRTAGIAFLGSVAVLGFIAWLVLLIRVAAGGPDRQSLGTALERANPRLMDRLNTLLFLERRREPYTQSFSWRIALQAQGMLDPKAPAPVFPEVRPWTHCLVFLVTLIATVLLYQIYSPWHRLHAAGQTVVPAAAPPAPELALPTNNVEQNVAWGEVRITDPGTDLKLTKVDVVPMQIEAAASQPLKQVAWYSTVNGAGESTHALPPPAEPKYAVYQPTVFLDEFNLSDWDVMTYYAKASAANENPFASDVYFVEVRPFREDILKMPGGEGGKAYQALSQISSLISRQQEIVRQTHMHVQKPPESENLDRQDRNKLSEAEGDLGESAGHLYADMAAKMENKPIGEALDNLAQAQKTLADAGGLLASNVMTEAQGRERTALSELVAARKSFQKAVSDHPKAFEEPEQEDTPIAEHSKKLAQIAEYRDEARVARKFVAKTLEEQRDLERQALASQRNGLSGLADQERQQQRALDEFEADHPEVFKGTQSEQQQARQAMGNAADALRKRDRNAPDAVHRAAGELAKLGEAMQDQTAGKQLADAYRLKDMLDSQIQTFDRGAQPGGSSAHDLQQTADDARQTLNQLKAAVEQEPTRDAFRPPLRDALSGQKKVDLDAKLEQVRQAEDDAARRQRSGEARDALGKVSRAFADSEPEPLQAARRNDSLKPDAEDSFNQGMAELDSLVKQLESGRKLSASDEAKQGRQALSFLQDALQKQFPHDEGVSQHLAQLEEVFKSDQPLDPAKLKRLMDELQRFSVETSEHLAANAEKPDVTNIDPSHLPPAYRGRIQKYFQRLSEK